MRIYVRVRTDAKDIRLPLQLLCNKSEWSKGKPRARKGTDKEALNSLKTKLSAIDTAIEKRIASITNDGQVITESDIKSVIDETFGTAKVKKEKKKAINLHRIDIFIAEYGKSLEDGSIKRQADERQLSELTVRGRNTFVGIFARFAEHHNAQPESKPLTWGRIDEAFRKEFVSFMESEGYANSTINKSLSRLRSIVRIAAKSNLVPNLGAALQSLSFVPRTENKATYLTEDEITSLYRMPLQGTQDRCRDLFLIQCLSGQRVSDVASINPHDIHIENGLHVWRLRQQKTDAEVKITLLGALDEIFKKYDYAPPQEWPQIINKNIKVVLEKLSKDVPTLAEEIEVLEKKCARKKDDEEDKTVSRNKMIRIPRYKAISNHSGRRSAATNMLDKGYSLKQIAARTGHKSLATLELYLKKSSDKYADEVAKIQMERAKDGKLLLF